MKGLLTQTAPRHHETIENIIESLRMFGLTDRGSIIYLYLLKNGPCKCKQIHNNLDFDRQATYKVLRELENQGLLSRILHDPIIYAATPLKGALNLVITKKRDEVRHLEKLRTSIITLFAQLPQTKPDPINQDFMMEIKQTALRAELETEIENSTQHIYYLKKNDYAFIYDLIPDTDQVEINETRVTSFIILDDKLYLIHLKAGKRRLIKFVSPGIIAAFTELYRRLKETR